MTLRGFLWCTEAAVALTVTRLTVLVLPSRRLTRLMGAASQVQGREQTALSPAVRRQYGVVRYGLLRVSKLLPWHSTCLVLALAGRIMLLRRGLSSVVRLGVRSNDGVFGAHAWLIANGGVIVVGGEEAASFMPLADFGMTR